MKFESEGSFRDTAYVRHTKEEIRDLAEAFHNGETFGSWFVSNDKRHLLYAIFLPLLFLNDIQHKLMAVDGCDEVYGIPGTDNGMTIAGYPCFNACRGIDVEDRHRLEDAMYAVRAPWANYS